MKSITVHGSERHMTCVKYNADGDLLFTSGVDEMLTVWRVEDGERLGTYHYIKDKPKDFSESDLIVGMGKVNRAINHFDVTQDSTRLAAARFDHVVIFDVPTGKFITMRQEDAKVEYVEWNRHPLKQDKLLLAHSSQGGEKVAIPSFKIYKIDEKDDACWPLLTHIFDFEGAPTVCGWGPCDESIIGASDAGKLYKWNLKGEELYAVTAHTDKITAMSFNKNRSVVLTAGRDSRACLWSTADLSLIKEYQCDRPLCACSISPKFDLEGEDKRCHMLLAGGQEAHAVTTTSADSGNFEILIVDMVYGTEIGRVLAHYSPTTCVTFSPNGEGFATGAYEGNCKIFPRFADAYFQANHV